VRKCSDAMLVQYALPTSVNTFYWLTKINGRSIFSGEKRRGDIVLNTSIAVPFNMSAAGIKVIQISLLPGFSYFLKVKF